MTYFRSMLTCAMCLALLSGLPVSLRAQAVFSMEFVMAARGFELSAESRVRVRFAPGLVWHGAWGTKKTALFPGDRTEDARTPAGLYRLRGGLTGLRPGERMCFGILSHSGRATGSSGAVIPTMSEPAWNLHADGARFLRTENGGILECGPVIYCADDPPEFGLLTPGAYELDDAAAAALRKLERFEFTEAELRQWSKVQRVNSASVSSKDGTVTQSFTSTFNPEEPDDEVEVSVEPEEGYDEWIPEGNMDQPSEPGRKPLKVKVKAHKKDDPEVPREALLTFSLEKVSRNKGVCMNWPANAAEGEGLRFRQKDYGEGSDVSVSSATSAKTTRPVEKVELILGCYDFGAWGVLRVTAKDKTGKDLKVKVRGNDTSDLDLPKDENGNRISDAWEIRWAGGMRPATTEDEDAMPAGDGHTGDAIPRYEEYRGFRTSGPGTYASPTEMVTDRHVRTDPRLKDVFICDQLGYGIGFFRQSGLCVHLVTPEECGVTRQGAFNRHTINPNRGEASLDEQYVLWLLPGAGALSGDDEGGANMKSDYGGWGSAGPPRDCEGVYVKVAAAQGGAGFDPAKKLKNTITHELAHACCVKHHGEAVISVTKVEYLVDQVDGAGKLHPKGSIDNQGSSLGPHRDSGQGASYASGDTHCYMTYKLPFIQSFQAPTFALWDKDGNRYTGILYNCGPVDCVQTAFCGAPATWRIGPAGPPDPGRGNCLSQFCVNHLKHP